MKRAAEAYKRWRHTHGYGVHSPFAYMMVKEIVRPGRLYRYYAETALYGTSLSKTAEGRAAKKSALLIHRFCARLAIRYCVVSEGIPPLWAEAARSAGATLLPFGKENPGEGLMENESRLLIATWGHISLEKLKTWISVPGASLWILGGDSSLQKALERGLPEGIMLAGKKSLIVINRPKTRFVRYTVNI